MIWLALVSRGKLLNINIISTQFHYMGSNWWQIDIDFDGCIAAKGAPSQYINLRYPDSSKNTCNARPISVTINFPRSINVRIVHHLCVRDYLSYVRNYTCWFNFDTLAQGNAYKPTTEPINYRGPGEDRTHYLQTEATLPAASCRACSLHATVRKQNPSKAKSMYN